MVIVESVLCFSAGTQQVFYWFNVSHIEASDVILQAELRLFKMRPTPQVRRQLRRRQGSRHVADVRTQLVYTLYYM